VAIPAVGKSSGAGASLRARVPCDISLGAKVQREEAQAEQTKTQLFQWLGFRSRSAPAPQTPSLGAVEGGVS
jgi:hypothetical protein